MVRGKKGGGRMKKLLSFLVIGVLYFSLTGQSLASGFSASFQAPNIVHITDRSSCPSGPFYPQLLDTDQTTIIHQFANFDNTVPLDLNTAGLGLMSGSTYYINDNCWTAMISNTIAFQYSVGGTPSHTVYTIDPTVKGGLTGLLGDLVTGALNIIVVALGLVGAYWLTKKLVGVLLGWFSKFNK